MTLWIITIFFVLNIKLNLLLISVFSILNVLFYPEVL